MSHRACVYVYISGCLGDFVLLVVDFLTVSVLKQTIKTRMFSMSIRFGENIEKEKYLINLRLQVLPLLLINHTKQC